MWVISCPVKSLLAYKEGLSSTELVNCLGSEVTTAPYLSLCRILKIFGVTFSLSSRRSVWRISIYLQLSKQMLIFNFIFRRQQSRVYSNVFTWVYVSNIMSGCSCIAFLQWITGLLLFRSRYSVGVPGGTLVSMNRVSTLCGWLVQRQGWRVRGWIRSSEPARSARANSWLDYQRPLEK
jgi:hypothetical protein